MKSHRKEVLEAKRQSGSMSPFTPTTTPSPAFTPLTELVPVTVWFWAYSSLKVMGSLTKPLGQDFYHCSLYSPSMRKLTEYTGNFLG